MPNPKPRSRTPKVKELQAIVRWDELSKLPVEAVNAFHLQVAPTQAGQPAEVVLNMGFLAPPLLAGTLEQQIEQAQGIDSVSIEPVSRVAFSLGRLTELSNAINQILKAIEAGAG